MHTSIEKIDVDKSTKEGVLEIIDLKIESDMNTFSQELKSFREIMDTRITSLEKALDTRTTSLKEEIHGLKWSMNLIFGILIAIFTAVTAVIIKNYF